MSGEEKKNGDYEVGYGKPPQHSKWPKGTSGNRHGRPKGSKNLKTDLLEELSELVEVKEGNRTRKITKQRALIKSLTARGIKGSDAAVAKLLDLHVKAFGLGNDGSGDAALSAEEREILASFTANLQSKTSSKQASASDTDGNTGDRL
jgi:Family of unknown function (DUF5681)